MFVRFLLGAYKVRDRNELGIEVHDVLEVHFVALLLVVRGLALGAVVAILIRRACTS